MFLELVAYHLTACGYCDLYSLTTFYINLSYTFCTSCDDIFTIFLGNCIVLLARTTTQRKNNMKYKHKKGCVAICLLIELSDQSFSHYWMSTLPKHSKWPQSFCHYWMSTLPKHSKWPQSFCHYWMSTLPKHSKWPQSLSLLGVCIA